MIYEQSLISKKESVNGFSVERNYINSKEYHDKFEKLPLSKPVIESLYKETGRLLEAVDGQEQEHMLAINARTGEPVIDNFSRPGHAGHTSFDEDEYNAICSVEDYIALVHSHSYNRPPSGQDIATYAKDDHVKISLIACHDGDLFAIISAKKQVAEIYERAYNNFREQFDSDTAKTLATKLLYDENQKHPLFDVRRL